MSFWPDLFPELQAEVRQRMCLSARFMMSLTRRDEPRPRGACRSACREALFHGWRTVACGYDGVPFLRFGEFHDLIHRLVAQNRVEQLRWTWRDARPCLSIASSIHCHRCPYVIATATGRGGRCLARLIFMDMVADQHRWPSDITLGYVHDLCFWLTWEVMERNNLALAHWLQDRRLFCNHADGDRRGCPCPGDCWSLS